MIQKILNHKWFVISLILTIFLAFFRFNYGIIQQDNYVGYAETMPTGVNKISFFDSRLLPGLPILIYLVHFLGGNYFVAGYLLTFLSFIGSYLILYKITGSKLSFLPLIFPPILLNLASLIDTEFPFIFLTLLGYWFLKKNKFAWAFAIIGISIWFRLAGFAVIFGIFVYFLVTKDLRKFILYLPYYLIPVVLLTIYNVHFFGIQNPFYQLFTYEALHPARISMGVIQLGSDLIRSFRWHWYRIFLSGLAYLIFFLVLWVKSIKFKSLEFWIITGIYIFTLSVNLVPFLENLGRYLAPTIPFYWLIFYKYRKINNSFLTLFLLFVSAMAVVL